MKKFTCLSLSILLSMGMMIPSFAAEEDHWSCIGLSAVSAEPRLLQSTLNVVEGNPFNDYVSEFEMEEVYVYPEGTSFKVENLDCKYSGIFIYFERYEPGQGTITTFDIVDMETYEEVERTIDLTGKYYGHGGVQYLSTVKDPWGGESIPAGNNLHWAFETYADAYASNLFKLQPGESITFTMPASTPDTLYTLYAAYNIPDEDYNYWRYQTFILSDDLYTQAKPITEQEPGNPFTDVPVGAYYHDAALWAYNNNITAGTSPTTFSPNNICTRGQVMTFLWNANGRPEPTMTKNPFTDVKETDYYYKAILWAYENKITSGTSATTFGPTDTCTSAHVVTFLWSANGKPSALGESSLAEKTPDQWYTNAVAWADTTGLLSGSELPFAPENSSPRADIITYLYLNMAK